MKRRTCTTDELPAKRQLANAIDYYMGKMGLEDQDVAKLLGMRENKVNQCRIDPEEESLVCMMALESQLRSMFIREI